MTNEKLKYLYKDKDHSIAIREKSGRLRIGILGKTVEKPFDNWIKNDTDYTNRVLVAEINRLNTIIDELKSK